MDTDTNGFYKKDGTQILFGTLVSGPGYMLTLSDKDQYSYPVDGWIFATSLDDAISKFANDPVQPLPYQVLPEDIFLDTSRSAQTEFNKLVTLLQLSLNQGKMTMLSPIEFYDVDGNKHITTVERFFEVVVDYGLFCYQQRFN